MTGFLAAPDPDVTVRLDPVAEAAECGVGVDEIPGAEDDVGWCLDWCARLTFGDDINDDFSDGRGLHYTLSTSPGLPGTVIKTVTPAQVRAYGEALVALADRAEQRAEVATR